ERLLTHGCPERLHQAIQARPLVWRDCGPRRFSECLRSAEESRTLEVVILRDRQPRAAFHAFREAAPVAQLLQDCQALPVPVDGSAVVPEGIRSLPGVVQALGETLSIAELPV